MPVKPFLVLKDTANKEDFLNVYYESIDKTLSDDEIWDNVHEKLVKKYGDKWRIHNSKMLKASYLKIHGAEDEEGSTKVVVVTEKLKAISKKKEDIRIDTAQWRLFFDFLAAAFGAVVVVIQVGLPIPTWAEYFIVSVALLIAFIARVAQYHNGNKPILCSENKTSQLRNIFYMKKDYTRSIYMTLIVYVGALVVNLWALGAFGEPNDKSTPAAVALTTFLVGIEADFYILLPPYEVKK